MRRAALAIDLLGALSTLALVAWKGRVWEEPHGLLTLLPLTLFTLAPYALAGLAVRLARGPGSSLAALAGCALSTAFGLVVYADALLTSENPLNLLVFLAVPVVQAGIAGAAILLTALLARREGRQATAR